MRNIKKKSFRAMPLILTPIAIASLYLNIDFNNKVTSIRKVDKDVYESLLSNGLVDEEIGVTDRVLSDITNFRLDASKSKVSDIVKGCSNLKHLTIDKANLLRYEDIEAINNSSIDKVMLMFYDSDITTTESHFDLSSLKKDYEIVLSPSFNEIGSYYGTSYSELYRLKSLDYLMNYDIDKITGLGKDDYDLYLKLDEIYKSLNIQDYMDDNTKITIISNYIINNFDYDGVAKDNLVAGINNDLGFNYNHHPISSVLTQETDDKKAICINYACIFNLLAYKANIKSRVVIGNISNDLGHAWNVVNVDEEYKYVDTTFMDEPTNEEELRKYVTVPGYSLLVNDEKKIIYSDVEYNDYFDFDMDYVRLFTEPETNYTEYINEELDGKKILTAPLDYLSAGSIGVITGGLCLLIYSLYDAYRKENKKKVLKR